jgi:hypothetical protein
MAILPSQQSSESENPAPACPRERYVNTTR